jgi:uncharacterized protein YjbI with pentapeptide repeats
MQKITQNNFEEIIKQEEIENICFYKINFSFLNLAEKSFSNCKFEKCNLSNTNFKDTTFDDVNFFTSKIMGVKFSEISDYMSKMNFIDCNLSMCCFYGMEIKNTSFNNSEIIDCNFTRTNLKDSDLSNSNFDKSTFSETNLTNVNFKGSNNFAIDPTINKLEKTKFSAETAILLLKNLNIIID